MTPSDSDLVDAMTFLQGRPCLLLDGDRIQLPTGLPAEQVAEARRLKPALLVLLTEALADLREERAAILEFQAGFTRAEAELQARVTP